MSDILKYILNLDHDLLMPLIVVIIALFMKMRKRDAILSGITLAVAFISISVVISFMFETINPVAIKFVENTNINLTIIDLGFSPMLALSFAMPLAVLMFPLQFVINILLIHFKLTNVLNIDVFNIWTKIFTAALVSTMTNSIILGFIAAIIQIIIELKMAEKIHHKVEEITNIKGSTCSHPSIIQAVIMFPINKALNKISFLENVNLDLEHLKKKIGLFGEDSVMGFLIGLFLSLFAGYSIEESIMVALKLAATLVLLPLVSSLFIKALNPLSTSAQKYMKEKYKGRDISIGLDWTILSGAQELWIVSILLIPINLLLAILLSKLGLSNILPLPGIVNTVIIVPALIIANRNILKMLIISTLLTPIYFMVSTYFAPVITEISKNATTITVESGRLISYYCLEAPFFRWALANFLQFKPIGIIAFSIFILLFIYFIKQYNSKEEIKNV